MSAAYFHQRDPFQVPTTDGKTILEHFGLVATQQDDVSIARMVAPAGWSEPFQTPEFGEFTLMVHGAKQIELADATITLRAGESIYIAPGTRVRYSNPFDEAADYWSVCIPAFQPHTVHRDA